MMEKMEKNFSLLDRGGTIYIPSALTENNLSLPGSGEFDPDLLGESEFPPKLIFPNHFV